MRPYNLSVGAADRAGGARVAATDADDVERRTVQADKTSEVAEHDAEKTGKDIGLRRGALSKAVSASDNKICSDATSSPRR